MFEHKLINKDRGGRGLGMHFLLVTKIISCEAKWRGTNSAERRTANISKRTEDTELPSHLSKDYKLSVITETI